MKKPTTILTIVASTMLMAGIAVAPMAVPHASGQISIHFGWQQPPPDYNQVRRQGFHDGIDAARRDIDRGIPPDARRHERFRHPPTRRFQRDDYRNGFVQGYRVAYQHRRDWDRRRHDWR